MIICSNDPGKPQKEIDPVAPVARNHRQMRGQSARLAAVARLRLSAVVRLRLGIAAGGLALALPLPGMAADSAPGMPAKPAPASALPLPDPSQALPRPASWQALLERSRASGQPIVVMFSTVGCPWCELVRRDHLRHLARDQQQLGVIVAELDLIDREPFGPRETGTPAGLARALGVRVAPTVLFMGPEGELAERLIGYQSADFYGAYVTRRIEQARKKLAPEGPASPPG